MSVKAIPEGYHTITPYLIVSDADHLITFLKSAFDAEVGYKSKDKEGITRHAEVQIGDSKVMMGKARSDEEITPAMLYLYTENTDRLYTQAIKSGAVSIMEPADQFYGDRNAGVKDPEGNIWWIATHVEDVSEQEIERRMNELQK